MISETDAGAGVWSQRTTTIAKPEEAKVRENQIRFLSFIWRWTRRCAWLKED